MKRYFSFLHPFEMLEDRLKIKKVIGFAFKEQKFHLRILWTDRYITWETPETLNCPLLLENFLTKIETKIHDQIEKENQDKKKIQEKQFMSSLNKNETTNSIPKTQSKQKTQPSKIKQIPPKKREIVDLTKKREITAPMALKAPENRKKKFDHTAYKPEFQKSNKQFLSDKRYFEHQSKKEPDHKRTRREYPSNTLDRRIGDYIVKQDDNELASLYVKEIVIEQNFPLKKIFNISQKVTVKDLEIFMFSLRQCSGIGKFDIFNVKFADSTPKFRSMCTNLDKVTFVDTTAENHITFFVGPKVLEKFDIYHTYSLLRFPKYLIRLENSFQLTESLNNDKNIWHKDDVDYSEYVFGHFLFKNHYYELEKVKKYIIFSLFPSYMCNELEKYLSLGNKKKVDFENTEVDTVFINGEHTTLINTLPYFIPILESCCKFFLVHSQSGPKFFSSIEPIFQNGGAIIFSDSFFESDAKDIELTVEYFLSEKRKWTLFASSLLISRCNDILAVDPQKSFYRELLNICQSTDSLDTSDYIEALRDLRSNLFKKRRFFYVLDPSRNHSFYRTPSRFMSIMRKSNL